jgi:hypothetical protein
MERLIVICEGGLHTVDYLQKNGVYPAAMVIEPSKFQDMSPYLSGDDDILLIIKGLTDFTMASIYALLNKFKEYQSKYKRVTIMTNIPLGNVDFDYYLYEGDIFYGNVQLVSGKKKMDIDINGNLIDNQSKSFFGKKGPAKAVDFNPVMYQYKKYNNKRVKLMIYGKVAMNDPVVTSQFAYEEKVKVVDLYK